MMTPLPRGLAARLAAWRVRPGALLWQPPPPSGGDPARARRLARGVLLLDGRLVESDADQPWDLPPPDRAWSDALHGHGWLDDAAAADDPALWPRFEHWVWAWIDRYGDGRGPGWRADLVARRLSRWIGHSIRLLRGRPPERSRAFFRSLASHARYLGWRWREIDGAARIEALGGLVYATLSMEGDPRAAARAARLLGAEAERVVGPDGDIASRNPEELARVLSVLAWSAEAIGQAGKQPAIGHIAAMRRAAPVVRALTMPDGSLARFHGGRSGAGLALHDAPATADALCAFGMPLLPDPPSASDERVMGYLRMAARDAVLVLDAATPPRGRHAATAHESALGFELWLGPQPVIVSCGSGHGFGERDSLAARGASAHSTVELGGRSPGRLGSGGRRAERENGGCPQPRMLSRGRVTLRTTGLSGGSGLAESTLYESDLGLAVERRLDLAADGTRLSGQDTVLAPSAAARARVARRFPPGAPPCPAAARFHLHPDIRAELALAGRAVALTLPDGSRWMIRSDAETLELQPSRFYDEGRAQPRATMQVVATTSLMQYWARIDWTLERVGDGERPRTARPAT